MHELGLATSLFRLVVEEAERAHAHCVVSVRLLIGALSHVEPSSLKLAFAAACAGTIADGAELEIERMAAPAHCLSCGRDCQVDSHGAACPHCLAFPLVTSGGDALRLTRLEVR